VPRLFEGEALTRLQSCWGRAQASAREQWEEAKAFGVLPEPLDGIYLNLVPDDASRRRILHGARLDYE